MGTVYDLARVQGARRDRIHTAVDARVLAVWARFDAPYDEGLVRELAEELASIVRAGQVQLSALTDAYLASVISVLTGRSSSPVGVTIPVEIRGLDPVDVYGRPASDYRRLVSEGVGQSEARARAATRLSSLADMDLSLGSRWASREVMRRRHIDRYRRVPMGAKPCGLCLAASTRIYYRENLLPIHGHCHCSVLPVTGEADPGPEFSDQQLQDLYERAGSTQGQDLSKVRYVVHEHGEYGPVITVGGQHFRGPAEAARLAS